MTNTKTLFRSVSILFVMLIMITVSLIPTGTAYAKGNDNASVKLNTLMKTYGYRVNSGTSLNCFQFATKVSRAMHGTAIGTVNSSRYSISTSTFKRVSTLTGRSANKSAVGSMLQKAYPGDIIQFTGPLTYQHTAVVSSVNNGGVTLYHSRRINGRYTIKNDYISWGALYAYWSGDFTRSGAYGISLYHHNDYNKHYDTVVKLSQKTATIIEGEELKLTAKVVNRKNKSVKWKTSNGNKATVSKGKVTAADDGKVTITAVASDGTKANCKITIKKAKQPELVTVKSKADITFADKGNNTANKFIPKTEQNREIMIIK